MRRYDVSRSAGYVTVLTTTIGDHLDALLHPSVRTNALARARHRAFMAPRLIGSLIALAALPAYLAVRGAPDVVEAIVFAWLATPILLSYFLSRTGRYEAAHILSALSLAALVLLIATQTGGIGSFALIWLVLVPIEAALCASRRVVAIAVGCMVGCVACLVVLQGFGLIAHNADAPVNSVLVGMGVLAAMLYASGLAFGMQFLMRASDTLRDDEEERYRLLASHMSDVMARHGRDGAVKFLSPSAETLLGAPLSHLMGHRLLDRVHVADRPVYLTALSDAARGAGDEVSVEFRARRDVETGDVKSGDIKSSLHRSEFVWIEMRCRALDSGAAHTSRVAEVVAVMRDISQRKMQQQELDAARAEVERANGVKARFLATMSHELRTPLNAIIGFSDMIAQEDRLMIDAARRKEYGRLINSSGQHLLSLVNSVLDISKLESGSFEFSPELFAPGQELINCCDLLALRARDDGVDLLTFSPKDLPQISGDSRAFRQIMINLVSNAIKFTERGGTVEVSACVDDARMIVRVKDTGIGIGSGDLKRVGEAFYQADKTCKRAQEGTGLGLSIVKNLVAMHGGEMTIDSEVGKGTLVTVALPRETPLLAIGQMEDLPELVEANNVVTLVPASQNERKNLRVKLSA